MNAGSFAAGLTAGLDSADDEFGVDLQLLMRVMRTSRPVTPWAARTRVQICLFDHSTTLKMVNEPRCAYVSNSVDEV